MEEKDTKSLLDRQLFLNIIRNNWVAVVFANMNNVIEYVNPAACRLYGYEEDELIGQTTNIFNSEQSHNADDIVKSIKERGYWFGEIIQRKKDNTDFDSLLSVQLIMNQKGVPIGFASNIKDITLQLQSEKRLNTIIEEKELLLKELHHRVKNNLAIIKGIISLQSVDELDDNCKKLIEDFKNRVDAVATLHNTLYDPENFDNLNLKSFINDLSGGLYRSYSTNGKKIQITNTVNDYSVDISKATPLCLIINEVITNSFKHGFADRNTGHINIDLYSENDVTEIKITDNGKGFDYGSIKKESLGISLIKDLSEQIDAKFKYNNVNGTQFSIYLNN